MDSTNLSGPAPPVSSGFAHFSCGSRGTEWLEMLIGCCELTRYWCHLIPPKTRLELFALPRHQSGRRCRAGRSGRRAEDDWLGCAAFKPKLHVLELVQGLLDVRHHPCCVGASRAQAIDLQAGRTKASLKQVPEADPDHCWSWCPEASHYEPCSAGPPLYTLCASPSPWAPVAPGCSRLQPARVPWHTLLVQS